MPDKRFNDQEVVEEVEREIRQRRDVYARKVYAGRMTQATMDRRIAILQQVADDYSKKLGRQPDMFGGGAKR